MPIHRNNRFHRLLAAHSHLPDLLNDHFEWKRQNVWMWLQYYLPVARSSPQITEKKEEKMEEDEYLKTKHKEVKKWYNEQQSLRDKSDLS